MFEMGANFEDGWSVDKGEKKSIDKESKPFDKHQLVFAKEKRKGKVVTIVKPFYVEKKALLEILKLLKKKLSTGGTLKENSLEFQGSVKERLEEELSLLGFRLK